MSSDSDDMFAGGSDSEGEKPQKKIDPQTLDRAKSRLSKWTARLFDPDRPRGLVEAPQVIPLNDEFLTAFGKREQENDKNRVILQEVGEEIGNPEDDEDDDDDILASVGGTSAAAEMQALDDACTVRCANLAYRTSPDALKKACEEYGSVVEVNMILDEGRNMGPNNHNSGRAFVKFDTPEGAEACVNGLKELDGRDMRMATVAQDKSSTPRRPKNPSALSRYWERDISTVCRRCGEVGHKESNCPNPAKAKPCALCAGIDHDMRDCPFGRVCFNCGIPGHVNRECKYPRGSIRRLVCGICFRSGHHRLRCQERAKDAPSSDAICMVCHKRGHFMCKDMKWFYSLEGVSCFNCGQRGHSGYDCRRPSFNICGRDGDMVASEIERAPAFTIELAERENEREKDRGRHRSRDDGNRRQQQTQSMPPRGQSSGSKRGRGYDNEKPAKRSRVRGYNT